ncbi:Tannase/feruloyl esterase [Leptodontidium sp. 2 PMI_412]|nr:Tannase/feruloyl esterase [Leptodontidium sp. 2 PMI_412]
MGLVVLSSLAAVLFAGASTSAPNSAPAPCKFSGVPAHSFNASCAALAKSISIENVTVNFAEYVPAGTTIMFPNADPSCARPSQAVPSDLCRVNMHVSTTNVSGIVLESWLPKDWTGRFLSTGNGGLGGCIQFEDMAYTIGQGFAVVGANNGHDGRSGKAFLNSPEVIADFAYRSIHTGVVVGKQITKEFYGTKHKKSYYLGCSTGGRQGFKSVQDFPYDFDGVVAGAPALDFNNLNAWSNHFYLITGKNTSASFVPIPLWTKVHTEILNQCDGFDGLKDGIIEDPSLCNFNASALLCARTDSTDCLTSAQVNTVTEVFSGLYGQDGALVYPRMQPGSELSAAGFYYGGLPSPFTDWYAYAILGNPNWDSATMTLADIAYADKKNPSNIKTWKSDLSPFQAAGGKILHYHGMQDPIITSDNSARYYDLVSKTMRKSPAQLDQFYRYFRIGGMGHCSGGPGAWEIGQTTVGTSALTSQDNVLMRIVDWVENGAAPETIRGTKYVNDTASLGVQFVRDHCRYPRRNVYNGKGDPTKATSWNCK